MVKDSRFNRGRILAISIEACQGEVRLEGYHLAHLGSKPGQAQPKKEPIACRNAHLALGATWGDAGSLTTGVPWPAASPSIGIRAATT